MEPHPRSVARCRLCGRQRSVFDLTDGHCSGTPRQVEECAETCRARAVGVTRSEPGVWVRGETKG